MRIVTWNINGVRQLLARPQSELFPDQSPKEPTPQVGARITSTISDVFDALHCQVLCVQETKVGRAQLTRDIALTDTIDSYFSFTQRATSIGAMRMGYSGVATYLNRDVPVLGAEDRLLNGDRAAKLNDQLFLPAIGLPPDLDLEGRSMVLDLDVLVLINLYCPSDRDDPARSAFKLAYHELVLCAVTDLLHRGQEVLLVGDLNVTRDVLDHCDPFAHMTDVPDGEPERVSAFRNQPTRQWMSRLLALGLVDVYRELHPAIPGFTCWNTLTGARASDFGTRIDYVLASPKIMRLVRACDRLPDVLGSDHCPVYVDLDWPAVDTPNAPGAALPLSSRTFPEFRLQQASLHKWLTAKPSRESRRDTNDGADGGCKPPLPLVKRAIQKPAAPKQIKLTQFVARRQGRMAPSGSGLVMELIEKQQVTLQPHDDQFQDDQQQSDQQQQQQQRQIQKQQWEGLLKGRSNPLCRHGEPCKQWTVNKPGPNQGRRFWLCARPVGPKSTTLTEFRCEHFEWDQNATARTGPS